MPTAKKMQIVEELTEEITRSSIIIGAEYKGLRVTEMGALRGQLGAKGVQVRVTKNTLLRLAAAAAGKPEVGELGEGPTAIIFSYGDAAETAKLVREYTQSAKNAFAPRRAFMEGQLLSARDLADIATLPPRPIMMGRLAGNIQAPVYRLAQLLASTFVHPTGQLLNSSLFQLAGLLDARAKQLEKA